MPYVVKSDRHYQGNVVAVLYHKELGLFLHECASTPEDAKQFPTKSEATKCAKKLGKAWYVEKV